MLKGEDKSYSHISSYAIIVFAIGLFLGVIGDIIWPIKIISPTLAQSAGILLLGIGTLLIFWSEKAGEEFSHRVRRGEVSEISHLKKGPYKYSRHPQYLGLGLLLIGLGAILNSFFVIVFSIISLIVVNVIFIKLEEDFLEKRHGQIYKEYKDSVKKWL